MGISTHNAMYGVVMVETAVALLPIFRSENQMRILTEIFWGQRAPTGAELARRTGVPQQTVAREVARLADAGMVVTERLGTAKVIYPSSTLPYATALRQLLAYAGGVIPILERRLGAHPKIEEVFIFGSWAARYRGDTGPPPNDVDVAVVSSSLTRFDLAEERLDVEVQANLAINLFVFAADSDRLSELRSTGVSVVGRVPR